MTAIAKFLRGWSSSGAFSKGGGAFWRHFPAPIHRAEMQAEFDALLCTGIIARTPELEFAIPIPSMRDWLIEHFGLAD